MLETKPKHKKRGFRSYFILLFGLFVLFYLYAAHTPTGYEDIRSRYSDVLDGTQDPGKPRILPSQVHDPLKLPTEDARKDENPPQPKVGLVHSYRQPDKVATIRKIFEWEKTRTYIPVSEIAPTDNTERIERAPELRRRITDEVVERLKFYYYTDIQQSESEFYKTSIIQDRHNKTTGKAERLGFPAEGSDLTSPWQSDILMGLRDDVLTDIAEANEKARLTPQQISERAAADIVRTMNSKIESLGLEKSYKPCGEGWYAFPEWAFSHVSIPVLRPVAVKQMEKLAVACIARDHLQAIECEEDLIQTLAYMGATINPTPYESEDTGWRGPQIPVGSRLWKALRKPMIAKQSGDRINEEIDFNLVAVALERYRREYGDYPTDFTALVPRYLNDSFLPDSDHIDDGSPTWVIYITEPSEHLVGQNQAGTNKLVNLYKADHGRLPTGPSDLRPYVADDKELESLECRLVKIEGVQIVCRIRMDTLNNELLYSLENDADRFRDKPDEQPELLRAESNEPQAIEVLARYPYPTAYTTYDAEVQPSEH